MAKFAIGEFVQAINPTRSDFGELGYITSDYRSGQEQQGYAIYFSNSGKEYWLKEYEIRAVDIDALLKEKDKWHKPKEQT